MQLFLLLPLLLSLLVTPASAHAPAVVAGLAAGKLAYQTRCASCHGEDLRGGVNAPSLRGVGAADLDFWMVTGRMPAAVPWVQVGHRGPQIGAGEIAAIERYVTAIAPGGPPIPEVAAGGDLAHGGALFAQNCQHCHGIEANGVAIGDADWAPSLHPASIIQVAEAIRVGPGNMPKFGERQLDAPALGDLASYVIALDTRAATRSFPLRSSGPVPEGLYGWLSVGALALLAYAYSKRPVARNAAQDSSDGSASSHASISNASPAQTSSPQASSPHASTPQTSSLQASSPQTSSPRASTPQPPSQQRSSAPPVSAEHAGPGAPSSSEDHSA